MVRFADGMEVRGGFGEWEPPSVAAL